ncbi:MAG: primosomal protein N' [Planctomycetes bacterium]|nr:primosomal protein N' [Planctomycetota bacterium]
MARRPDRSPGLFDALEPSRPVPQPDRALYAQVAVDLPVETEFTYRVPEGARVAPGARVFVGFGARGLMGVVTELTQSPTCDPRRIKPIQRVFDEEPAVEGDLLALSERIASQYACGRGQALAAMLPAPLRTLTERRRDLYAVALAIDLEALAAMEAKEPERYRLLRTLREAGGELRLAELLSAVGVSSSPAKTLAKRGLLRLEWREPAPDPLLEARATAPSKPHELSDEQRAAVDAIATKAVAREFASFVLFGVTGSGKTEVYLQALAQTLAAGRSGLVLVPEISLTPQTVERFRARFGEVAVLHSHLTDRSRAQQWQQIRSGRARVVVGARSAIFAPLRDLGLVIVDEEHEPSFKQGSTPRYHARDVALWRGELARAAVVLGSATPSLESWKSALDGKHTLVRLTRRVAGGELPPVRICDLRRERAKEMHLGADVPMTRPLKIAVERALERKERVILFLNRRGFAPVLWCSACGKTVRCGRCAVSLTYHRRVDRLVCHLCHHEMLPVTSCPECKAPSMKRIGAGTERIEQLVLRAFPQAHVARMDSDTTLARGSHEAILGRFRRGEVDVLVGTQMIAKGLDVPEVTVVGVMNADATLHIPEYHSSERTFQLVAQVAGRAGRSVHKGEVIVQTSLPGHPAIELAAKHDFESFAAQELAQRKLYRYPPYARLARVLVEADDEEQAKAAIESASQAVLPEPVEGVERLGPVAAPIALVKGRARWHFLLRCSPPERLEPLLPRLRAVASHPLPGGIRPVVDVDPLSTL